MSKIIKDSVMDFTLNLRKPNKLLMSAVSFAVIILLGFIDYITGFEISISIFYLIPISIAVIFINFRFGIIISILSALSWYMADVIIGGFYQVVLISVWNTLIISGYFMLHVFILSNFINIYNKTKMNSLTDSLTHSMNSRFFYELFERESKRAERTGRTFTLVYMDLDNFKLMNDTNGHPAGDLLLQKFSLMIKNNIRQTDLFARMGGDEFVVLFPETDFDVANSLIKRMKENICIEMENNDWPVTLSIGALTFRKFEKDTDEMIKMADDLMYKVKKSGKNGINHEIYE